MAANKRKIFAQHHMHMHACTQNILEYQNNIDIGRRGAQNSVSRRALEAS